MKFWVRQVALEILAPPLVRTMYTHSPYKKKLSIFLPLPQCQPDWVQADGVHRGYSFIFGHAGLSIFKHFPPIWNPLRAGLFHPFGNHANDIAKLAKIFKSSLCFSPNAKWISSIACFESFNFPNGGNKNKQIWGLQWERLLLSSIYRQPLAAYSFSRTGWAWPTDWFSWEQEGHFALLVIKRFDELLQF